MRISERFREQGRIAPYGVLCNKLGNWHGLPPFKPEKRHPMEKAYVLLIRQECIWESPKKGIDVGIGRGLKKQQKTSGMDPSKQARTSNIKGLSFVDSIRMPLGIL